MPFDKVKMEELIESGKTMKEVSEELGRQSINTPRIPARDRGAGRSHH
ncbi:MAG: hypothetical protein MZU91_08980 [Desulfosudis oleivorans]|nr:hypothetical protein [Desulfosudis oleivorans]